MPSAASLWMSSQIVMTYFPFNFGNAEHELFRKSFDVTFYGLIQCTGRNLVERRKVEVEHHALAADFVDFALYGCEFFHQ